MTHPRAIRRSVTPVSSSHAPVRVAVLADTHLRDGLDRLPAAARRLVGAADVVLHAGDVCDRVVLDALAAGGRPVHAVLGNNDHPLVGILPERLELTLAGVQVALVHDSGARAGRERRLRRWFPDADLVVFGHSHEPCDAEGEDGQRLFNPGSAVQRRRQPNRTMGWLVLAEGVVHEHRVVVVDD